MMARPVAIAPDPGGVQVIGDASGAAEAFGVVAGMRLGEALGRCPSLALVPSDPQRAEEAWERSLATLEGIGAALVLPALVALIGGNYQGKDRALAYGVLGGVAGAGIAVGPILGGWATTELSWRVVFVGEVVVAIGILFGTRLIREPAREGPAPRLDWVGSALSALGLALIVVGVLQASNWGWLLPTNSPIEPFGLSLTPFVIVAGGLVLAGFRAWERRREEGGLDPLIHFRLFGIENLRGGVAMLRLPSSGIAGIAFAVVARQVDDGRLPGGPRISIIIGSLGTRDPATAAAATKALQLNAYELVAGRLSLTVASAGHVGFAAGLRRVRQKEVDVGTRPWCWRKNVDPRKA